MSESYLIWLIAAGLVVVVFVPYLLKFRRSQKVAAERKEEARSLGIDRATGQYPMVNRSLCIGCGSCVDACPEGDVLAVVWGAAEVVNGQRCVGHGFCETACPVGALKVGLGDVRTRPDIPLLSEYNETTVPGIFIAGELSGLSLIRHAIAQGKMVAEEIARRSNGSRGAAQLQDIVVVGAGPAGLSAALAARQHGLSAVVMDQYDLGGTILHYPRRKMVMTQPVEIPSYGLLNREEYSKEDLMEIWQQVCRDNQIEIRAGEKLSRLERFEGGFRLTADSGMQVEGRFVVLALGRRGSPRKLGVSGEDLPKVMYQLTDAQAYRNSHVLVVGGGDSAVEAAIGLARQKGNTVAISYRKSRFFRIKKKNEERIGRLLNSGDITPYFDSNVRQITASTVTLSTSTGDMDIPNDYVIIQAGGVPPYDMLKSFGIAFGGETVTVEQQDVRFNLVPA
jgi:thioredoxin reductase/NAD-dependent dihydropyrimidine dehydrogenase PreA subunit